MYDVTIYDAVGVGVSHKLYELKGLGGSEFQQLLLAESLAENGNSVLYVSKNPSSYTQKYEHGKIDYKPLGTDFETNNLILIRNSSYAWETGKFKKVFVWAHDTNYGDLYPSAHSAMFKNIDATLICVSQWQAKLFEPLGWKTIVIPNMIPDSVFSTDTSNKKKQFIYASAAWKGLPNTISIFNQLKNSPKFSDYKLKILSPGYENFDGNHLSSNDIEWVGSVKFSEVVQNIAESEALLYYNTMAETFGIVPLLAAQLQTTPLVYQADKTWYPGGAIPEIIGERFVANTFPQFISIIYNKDNLKTSLDYRDYARRFTQSVNFTGNWLRYLNLDKLGD